MGCFITCALPCLKLANFAACRVPRPMQGVTFACVNAAAPGEDGGKAAEEGGAEGEGAAAGVAQPHLATFALRIKAPEVLDAFVAAVNQHKAGGPGKTGEAAA